MTAPHTLTPCHIDTLKAGDTVVHDGQMITVCPADLKRGGFMGTTFKGDSYHAGHKPVMRVTFTQSGATK